MSNNCIFYNHANCMIIEKMKNKRPKNFYKNCSEIVVIDHSQKSCNLKKFIFIFEIGKKNSSIGPFNSLIT